MQKVSPSFMAFKKNVIKYRFVLLFIAVGVLFLPQIQPTGEEAPDFVYFFGRFHPLIIHFPIVLVFLVLVFELLKRFNIGAVSANLTGSILAIALLGSLVAVGLGFLLFYTGEYSGDIMQQHLWGGVILTASLALACFLFLHNYKSESSGSYLSYLSVLVFANVALIYTSHQGGSLTHGSEFLTEYMPSLNEPENDWEPKPMEEMLVFEDMIIPIMDKKCMSCHNSNKTKGGLILTSYEDILQGGKSEHPTLKPGDLGQSELYQRVMLPRDDEKHMPPDGKVPLSHEEITLLEWWISNGAEPELLVQEAAQDPQMQPFITTFITDLENQRKARYMQQKELESMIVSVSSGNRYKLSLDEFGDGRIALSMAFPPTSFEDNDLMDLQPLFPQISKASMVASNITDDALYYIGQMSSLRELYLQQTKINGSGLVFLGNLPKLQLLDLSKSAIEDGHLLHVLKIGSLQELYLNSTQVSPEVIKAIQVNRPDVTIHLERGNFF
ncbi:c-type cytochrome domain-containing protein [Lunatibacter salilacus]|uniref:c-type cytochrome domain-containing protein n=1 Tax=Lunatibacter salilacus TaxID=2483804 RepID=UPI00131DA98D|nr:c-type cytochrome domain-containing protein [Lunatibacter salilacus]